LPHRDNQDNNNAQRSSQHSGSQVMGRLASYPKGVVGDGWQVHLIVAANNDRPIDTTEAIISSSAELSTERWAIPKWMRPRVALDLPVAVATHPNPGFMRGGPCL
jgi:hypothetical protein